MSRKSQRIASLIGTFQGGELDARYIGYFDCFNRQLFYEAHDVLEELWLGERQGPNGAFYKGLIQLAGAFVHLQKHRTQPAAALFKLARKNLAPYPERHEKLDRAQVLGLIDDWLAKIGTTAETSNLLDTSKAPVLCLCERGMSSSL